jgi:hypothetical protein
MGYTQWPAAPGADYCFRHRRRPVATCATATKEWPADANTGRSECHEARSRGWLPLGRDSVVRDSGSRSWRSCSRWIAGSMHGLPRGRAGWSTSSSPREGAMSSTQQLLDTAGRRRSPATLSAFHAGRAPGNKGQRYAADPPTVDEIIAVMRHAGHARYGNRLNGLIVVLWRSGLRISEALSLIETDLEERRGSILVRHGKNDRRRQVGMDAWGWTALGPWLAERAALPVGPWTHCRAHLVGQRRQASATPGGGPGGRPAALRAAPAPPCACCRAVA